ncbi:MAG: preprotein translocase subunit YajC [Treponema sp.]|jgi:preprotein translocase subunit YajC|nr:preprotein translocase subunit YajC [Treponema sp.]
MNLFVLPLLMGNFGGGSGSEGGPFGNIMTFFPFVLIIAIFYFLIIRPQNKKQKETQRMLEALKKGDKIVTIGGVHGVIQNVKESSVIVRVDENTKIEFSRSAISTVAAPGKEDKSEKAGEKQADKIEDKSGEASPAN